MAEQPIQGIKDVTGIVAFKDAKTVSNPNIAFSGHDLVAPAVTPSIPAGTSRGNVIS